jgi:hypothetical protein
VYGPIIITVRGDRSRFRLRQLGFSGCFERFFGLGVDGRDLVGRRILDRWTRAEGTLCRLGYFGAALAPLRRNPRLLVLVVGVARRTARLLHLVLDHRHDGVIGDAALARTIVVDNVTEPNPALLHVVPGYALR